MKLKTYPKYKDSGNAGITVINMNPSLPNHWNIRKLKFLLRKPVTDGPHETPEFIDEGIPFLSVDSIQDGKLVFENCRYITEEDHLRYKQKCNPQKNNILIGKAASIGKIAIVDVDFEFSTWSPLALLRPNQSILPKFLEYSLKSDYCQDQIDLYATSNTQKNISMDDIPRIQIIIPSIADQQKIANFLDKQTAKIDAMIEKDKKLIALLKEKRTALINHAVTKGLDQNVKLKDSGIEWVGKIPEGWEVRKLKQVTSIMISNVDKKSKPDEEEVLLCNYNEVYNNEFITLDLGFMKATASIEQINKFSIKKEDVIITKDSETPEDIAVPSLVEENLNNIVCGYHLALIRPNGSKIKGKFLLRIFQSKKINDQFVISANGVTRFGISTYPIKNSFVIVPPLHEQTAIANFLDQATSKMDKTINLIQNKITLLEEY